MGPESKLWLRMGPGALTIAKDGAGDTTEVQGGS